MPIIKWWWGVYTCACLLLFIFPSQEYLMGTEEMEDPTLLPNTHFGLLIITYNFSSWKADICLCGYLHSPACIHTWTHRHIHIYLEKNNKSKSKNEHLKKESNGFHSYGMLLYFISHWFLYHCFIPFSLLSSYLFSSLFFCVRKKISHLSRK